MTFFTTPGIQRGTGGMHCTDHHCGEVACAQRRQRNAVKQERHTRNKINRASVQRGDKITKSSK